VENQKQGLENNPPAFILQSQSVFWDRKGHILTTRTLAASSNSIVAAFTTTTALVHVVLATSRKACAHSSKVSAVEPGGIVSGTLATARHAGALVEIAGVGFGEGVRQCRGLGES